MDELETRQAGALEPIVITRWPWQRLVGANHVRVLNHVRILQRDSVLVLSQPPVVLRDEEAPDRTLKDRAFITAQFVRWPKIVAGLLANQRVRYPQFSAQVTEI